MRVGGGGIFLHENVYSGVIWGLYEQEGRLERDVQEQFLCPGNQERGWVLKTGGECAGTSSQLPVTSQGQVTQADPSQ